MKVACIQMDSGAHVAENLRVSSELIRAAAGQGAQFIALPEVLDQVVGANADTLVETYTQDDHPALPLFSALAAEIGVWILLGSICVRAGDKRVNRSILINDKGRVVAQYDKIHLYEADLPNGEQYRESRLFAHGTQAVVAATPWGGVGLTVCYDLRFGHLYRDLAKMGAGIITVPAAFTMTTGRVHWRTLLKARAIETGCFILAPAQGGTHEGARSTWGHSMIIEPWGKVLAERAQTGAGIITADLDLNAVARARAAIPSLRHDRAYIR